MICWPKPESREIADVQPDLTNRRARCFYHGKNSTHKCQSHYRTQSKTICKAEEPSDVDLPFFEYKLDKEYDIFYCGCHGWD